MYFSFSIVILLIQNPIFFNLSENLPTNVYETTNNISHKMWFIYVVDFSESIKMGILSS